MIALKNPATTFALRCLILYLISKQEKPLDKEAEDPQVIFSCIEKIKYKYEYSKVVLCCHSYSALHKIQAPYKKMCFRKTVNTDLLVVQ